MHGTRLNRVPDTANRHCMCSVISVLYTLFFDVYQVNLIAKWHSCFFLVLIWIAYCGLIMAISLTGDYVWARWVAFSKWFHMIGRNQGYTPRKSRWRQDPSHFGQSREALIWGTCSKSRWVRSTVRVPQRLSCNLTHIRSHLPKCVLSAIIWFLKRTSVLLSQMRTEYAFCVLVGMSVTTKVNPDILD